MALNQRVLWIAHLLILLLIITAPVVERQNEIALISGLLHDSAFGANHRSIGLLPTAMVVDEHIGQLARILIISSGPNTHTFNAIIKNPIHQIERRLLLQNTKEHRPKLQIGNRPYVIGKHECRYRKTYTKEN